MTYKVRRNATTDSRAFVAACEAFSSERHPVVRPSTRVQQPPGGVSMVEFGHHDVAQDTEALMKSRPGSDSRKSEMHGSVSRRTDLEMVRTMVPVKQARASTSRPMGSANDLFKLVARKVHYLIG